MGVEFIDEPPKFGRVHVATFKDPEGVELVTALLDRSVATILDLDCDEMIPA